ncbi:MAG: hypothetical protein V1681_05930 [Candidatus Neomarinimicrobiota bacterium]
MFREFLKMPTRTQRTVDKHSRWLIDQKMDRLLNQNGNMEGSHAMRFLL